MSDLSFAALFLSAGFALVAVVFNATRIVNDVRDKIVGDNEFDLRHKKHMFRSDWVPLQFGLTAFLLIVLFSLAVLFIALGGLAPPIVSVFPAIAMLVVFALAGTTLLHIWTFAHDYRYVGAVLRRLESRNRK